MNNKVHMAKYILSVATNNVTEDARENYKMVMDVNNLADCKVIFRTILGTVLKSISSNKYDSKIGLEIIGNEYSKLNLSPVLGDYNNYSSFVTLLVETRDKEYVHSELLDLYKHWIEVADSLMDDLKVYIYHSVLNALVKRNLVAEDLDFSEKVTEFVGNNNETYEDR